MNDASCPQPLVPLSPACSVAYARRGDAVSPSHRRGELLVYNSALEHVLETKNVQATTAASRKKALDEALAEDLSSSHWKTSSLVLAHKGATLVSGADVTRVGDAVPVLEPHRLDGTRARQTLEARVQSLLEYIARFLVEDINQRIPQPKRGFSSARFSLDEMMAILDMLLEQVNDCTEAETVREYLRLTERLGYYAKVDGSWARVSRTRYQLFRSLLQFDPHALCEALSEVLLDSLAMHTVPGSVVFFAGDESMIPGDFDASVFVPRKPQPLGLRLFVVGGRLTSTGRPVVVSILPDFARKNAAQMVVGNVHRPVEVLESIRLWYIAHKERLPQHVWVTVDSLFSYPAMLEAWEAVGLHGSMALREDLYKPLAVLGHGLAYRHSRIIDTGSFLVSVYRDKKLVATAATGFTTNASALTDAATIPMPPLLEPTGAFCLWLMEQLSLHDLEYLGVLLNRKAEAERGQDATYSLTHQPYHMADCLTVQQLQFVAGVVGAALQRKEAEAPAAPNREPSPGDDNLATGVTPAGQAVAGQAVAGQGAAGDKRSASEPASLAPPRKKRKASIVRDRDVHLPLVAILRARNFPYTDRSRVAKAKDVLQLAKAENIDISACQGEEQVAATVLKAMTGQEEQTGETGGPRGPGDEAEEDDDDQEARTRDIVPELASDAEGLEEVLDKMHGVGWQDKIGSVEDIKAKFTSEQLAREIRRLCPGAKVTGDKSKLASKLRLIMFNRATNPRFARKCLTSTQRNGKSLLTCFHGNTFNAVDIFDLLMSSLAVKYTGTSQNMHMLRWLVRLVFVQSHSLHEASRWTHEGKEWYKRDQEECKRQMQTMARAHKAYIAARKARIRAAWNVYRTK